MTTRQLVWDAAQAGCWLANCSSGPAPFIGPETCWGGGELVAQGGDFGAAVNRWLDVAWIAMLAEPELALPSYACIARRANADVADVDSAAVDPDEIAMQCFNESDVPAAAVAKLREDYTTWRGGETVSYAATVTAVHLVRSQPTPGGSVAWPLVTIAAAPAGEAQKVTVYSGPRTAEGLRQATCAAWAAAGGAPAEPCANATHPVSL